MIQIVKKKIKIKECVNFLTGKVRVENISFIVADREGVRQLQHGEVGGIMQFEFLSCGHYIFPALGTHAHAKVKCPICGDNYIMSGHDGKHEHLNGKQSEVFAIHTEQVGHNRADQLIINETNKKVIGLQYL